MAEKFSGETRWGTGDQTGAANLITPESRLVALELVSSGEQIFEKIGNVRFIPRTGQSERWHRQPVLTRRRHAAAMDTFVGGPYNFARRMT